MARSRFQSLSKSDRRDALEFAANLSGRPAHLLEKDVWIVQTLRALFDAPCAKDLAFKGGTSLAKAYRAIRRFSEDIDITYDIRAFAPDLVATSGPEAIPPTRSQGKRWTREIRARLSEWVEVFLAPSVRGHLREDGWASRVSAQGNHLRIGYPPLFDASSFVRPEVIVDLGARSTGEPRRSLPVICDAAELVPELEFPSACPAVLSVERTFWEKATAMHVYCLQRRRRGERLSRHWHDVVRLDDAGLSDSAMANRAVALAVARHKAAFFRENDLAGTPVDYKAAVTNSLRLVPTGAAYEALAEDYRRMLADGMLLDEKEPFTDIVDRCREIEGRAND